MKKNYIYPVTEIIPIGTMVALCESGGGGETNETVGGGNSGGNPWTGGFAPARTAPF